MSAEKQGSIGVSFEVLSVGLLLLLLAGGLVDRKVREYRLNNGIGEAGKRIEELTHLKFFDNYYGVMRISSIRGQDDQQYQILWRAELPYPIIFGVLGGVDAQRAEQMFRSRQYVVGPPMVTSNASGIEALEVRAELRRELWEI